MEPRNVLSEAEKYEPKVHEAGFRPYLNLRRDCRKPVVRRHDSRNHPAKGPLVKYDNQVCTTDSP